MFGSFGWMELVLILIIVLIIFGAGKLPQLGEGLGKAIKGFKKTVHEADAIDVTPEELNQAVMREAMRYPGQERQVLDIYAPKGASKAPVVFWIHGGGWQTGDKSEVKLKPKAFTDKVSQSFRDLVGKMNYSPDNFIRTTEKRHYVAAQALWEKLVASGDIYLGKYAGWYAIRDEAFYGEDELTTGADGKRRAPSGAEVGHLLGKDRPDQPTLLVIREVHRPGRAA